MKKLHNILTIPFREQNNDPNNYQSLIYKENDKIYYCHDINYSLKNSTPQQLLLISNDIRKVGDWYVGDGFNGQNKFKWSKSQKLHWPHDTGAIIAAYPNIEDLPSFSKNFIEEWCKNPVNEVEVEYETLGKYGRILLAKSPHNNETNSDMSIYSDYLKLTPDHEVICTITEKREDYVFERSSGYAGCRNMKTGKWIHAVEFENKFNSSIKENMYSEKEVIKLFEDWLDTKIQEKLMRISSKISIVDDINFYDWFEQNKKK